MRQTHSNLTVARLSPEQHSRTCDYWYTVTSNSSPHTAFVTRAGLDRWFQERGLHLESPLSDTEWNWVQIEGAYCTESHLRDASIFPTLKGVYTRTLSNGDWVEAIITQDDDGIRTVHTLNPNIRGRKVFDYQESCKMMM